MASMRPREWVTRFGKHRSGYEVSWYDDKGKRQRKLFSGPGARDKAQRKRTQLEHAKHTGAPLPVEAPAGTVRSAATRWVRYVERELKRERTTWGHYEQQLEDHICAAKICRNGEDEVAFGDLKVTEVTAPDGEALKDALLQKLEARYAAPVLTVARMLFNDIVRRGERLDNPLRVVRVRQSSRDEEEVEIPSKEDARALAETARTVAPLPPSFGEVWVVMTMFSGLRPSENRGAALEDLVLDGSAPGINVRRRADQWGEIGPVKTKNARRFVPLPPGAVALLKRWLLVVPRGDGFPDPERPRQRLHLLFPTSIGTVQSLANIYNRVWAPLLCRAGLAEVEAVLDRVGKPALGERGEHLIRWHPRYSVNCLRHFAASLMIDDGLEPKTIQKRMGHSSIKVTYDLYGHLFEKREADAAAVARIEKNLLG